MEDSKRSMVHGEGGTDLGVSRKGKRRRRFNVNFGLNQTVLGLNSASS